MNTTHYAYEPGEPVAPGQTLVDWLETSDMTQTDFAKRTGLTPKHINQVVKGGVGISPEVAIAFDRVTAIPARYWNQLEANYQTAKLRVAEEQDLARHVHLVERFPIKELERANAIPRSTSKLETLRALLRFFAVANPDALEEVWLRPALYRRSTAFNGDDAALAAWLRLAEREAATIVTQPFDPAACRAALADIRALSRLPGVQWHQPLCDLMASVGVALVILKEFPGCRINGATRWLSPDKALIVLSLRHRRNDILWFTLFHELCHLLRHSKKESFVHIDGGDIATELEEEADTFAAKILIAPHDATRLPLLTTESDVVAFADSIGVAPGIVVGRMQHDRQIPFNKFTRLIDRYRFDGE